MSTAAETKKKYDMEYIKNSQKRIAINWLAEDYKNRILPAIQETNLPVSTFIKQAVEEKIKRMNTGNDELDLQKDINSYELEKLNAKLKELSIQYEKLLQEIMKD